MAEFVTEPVTRPAVSSPRRPGRLPRRMVGLALLAGIVCVLPGAAQQAQSPERSLMAQDNAQNNAQISPFPAVPPNWQNMSPFNNSNPLFTEKRLELMNIDRQKTMVANANKLLKLAQKLNAEVNGVHTGTLTEDQLSEVKEIEKLAHKVREEMSFSVQQASPMRSLPIPLFIP